MSGIRSFRALITPALLMVVASVATCRLDMLLKPSGGTSGANPALAVSPLSIRDSARAGSNDERTIPIEIRNGGSGGGGTGGGEFEWSAEERHPWIRLSERDGTVPDTITLTLDPEDLDPGTHEGAVTISAPGMADSQVTISVTFIAQRPGLIVLPAALEHSANVTSPATFQDTLRISNGGNGPLVWTAQKSRSWVTLGVVAGSGAGAVPVTIRSDGLPPGTHRDEIVVTAPGASGSPARIDVTLTVFAPGLVVTPGGITETADPGSTTPETATLRVSNSGSGTLTWAAAKSAPWLTLSASAGTAPQDVVVTLNPTGLPPGTHADTIVFTSPEATNDPIRVPVELSIAQPSLVVTPTQIADAAGPGDTQKRTHALIVTNGGTGVLSWTATKDEAWIAIAPAAGGTPDTIYVTLDPVGLAAGVHDGEVVVSAPGASGSPARISVTFSIAQACNETGISPDVSINGALGGNDCQSPRRPGSFAELYAINAAEGDVIGINLSAEFDAYLILSDGAGTILAQNNDCSGGTGRAACIREFRIPASGRYIIDATSAAPGETGSFTLTVTRELPPPAPQGLGQRRAGGGGGSNIDVGETIDDDEVDLRGTVADPNPRDSVRLEVEVEPLGSPFTNVATHTSAFVPASGGGGDRTVTIRVADLSDDTGYHWQARTCDRTGRCSPWLPFGGNAESDADFRVSLGDDPDGSAPAQFQADGVTTIPVGGEATGASVVLAATATDRDAADVLRLEVEIKETSATFNGENLLTATGLSSGAVGTVSFAPTQAAAYHWRARVCDQTDRCSEWLSFPHPAPNAETDPDFRGPPPPSGSGAGAPRIAGGNS